MVVNARNNKLVPPELFATAGSSDPNATMTKVLYMDICWTQHRNRAVVSVDLEQCYDVVGYSVCSIALKAYGVPKKSIVLMLITLQTMNFWLRTAFGESSEAFGGTTNNFLMG